MHDNKLQVGQIRWRGLLWMFSFPFPFLPWASVFLSLICHPHHNFLTWNVFSLTICSIGGRVKFWYHLSFGSWRWFTPFLSLSSTVRGWTLDLSSANPVVSPRTLILKLVQGQERTVVGHWNLNRLFQLRNSCYPPIFGSPEFLGPFPFSTMFPQNHSNSLFILVRVRFFLHSYGGTREITEEEESIWDDWWFHIHLGISPL